MASYIFGGPDATAPKIKQEPGVSIKREFDDAFNMSSIPETPRPVKIKKEHDRGFDISSIVKPAPKATVTTFAPIKEESKNPMQGIPLSNPQSQRRYTEINVYCKGWRFKAHYNKKMGQIDLKISVSNRQALTNNDLVDAETRVFQRLQEVGFDIEPLWQFGTLSGIFPCFGGDVAAFWRALCPPVLFWPANQVATFEKSISVPVRPRQRPYSAHQVKTDDASNQKPPSKRESTNDKPLTTLFTAGSAQETKPMANQPRAFSIFGQPTPFPQNPASNPMPSPGATASHSGIKATKASEFGFGASTAPQKATDLDNKPSPFAPMPTIHTPQFGFGASTALQKDTDLDNKPSPFAPMAATQTPQFGFGASTAFQNATDVDNKPSPFTPMAAARIPQFGFGGIALNIQQGVPATGSQQTFSGNPVSQTGSGADNKSNHLGTSVTETPHSSLGAVSSDKEQEPSALPSEPMSFGAPTTETPRFSFCGATTTSRDQAASVLDSKPIASSVQVPKTPSCNFNGDATKKTQEAASNLFSFGTPVTKTPKVSFGAVTATRAQPPSVVNNDDGFSHPGVFGLGIYATSIVGGSPTTGALDTATQPLTLSSNHQPTQEPSTSDRRMSMLGEQLSKTDERISKQKDQVSRPDREISTSKQPTSDNLFESGSPATTDQSQRSSVTSQAPFPGFVFFEPFLRRWNQSQGLGSRQQPPSTQKKKMNPQITATSGQSRPTSSNPSAGRSSFFHRTPTARRS